MQDRTGLTVPEYDKLLTVLVEAANKDEAREQASEAAVEAGYTYDDYAVAYMNMVEQMTDGWDDFDGYVVEVLVEETVQ